MTVGVPHEALRRHGEDALTTLFVRTADPIRHGVGRPGLSLRSLLGWARHDLQLRHACGSLAMGGTQTVSPGVASPDDDHVLTLNVDG